MLGQEKKKIFDPLGGVGVGGNGGLQLGGGVGDVGEKGEGTADLLADGKGCGSHHADGHPAGGSNGAHRPHTHGHRTHGQPADGHRPQRQQAQGYAAQRGDAGGQTADGQQSKRKPAQGEQPGAESPQGHTSGGDVANGEDALCHTQAPAQVDVDQRQTKEGDRAAVLVVPGRVVVVDDGGLGDGVSVGRMGRGLRTADQIVQGNAEVVGDDQKIFDVGTGRAGIT